VKQAVDITHIGIIIPNMGTIHSEPTNLSDALFSRVQHRVLALIFGRPDRSFYTSEIIRNVRSGSGAVERELVRLQQCGLVSVQRVGNQKHYRANRQSPIFQELQTLVVKTGSPAEPLRRALGPWMDSIKAAFIYGSIARGTDTAESDIDLMVVGERLNYSDLYSALQDVESGIGRQVSPMFLSMKDWRRKASGKGSFVGKLNESPKIFLIGSERDLA
jgi:predicted nucleotidyltransferase